MLQIKNISLPASYDNPKEKIIFPYAILSKNTIKNHKSYVLYLSGGPVGGSDIFSFRHSTEYNYILWDLIERFGKTLLDNFQIIIIDDRVNDIKQTLKCKPTKVPWSDFLQKTNYQVNVSCNKDLQTAKSMLSDNADTKNIKNILKYENITKTHIIGASFGARRAINFIKSYPQMILSFSSLHGDIYSHQTTKSIENANNYFWENLDLTYKDSKYNWPFTAKPSELSHLFDNYIKKKLPASDYANNISGNNAYIGLGYTPLDEHFFWLIDDSYVDNLAKSKKQLVANTMLYLRLCDSMNNKEVPTFEIKGHLIQTICKTTKKNKTDDIVHIPDYIPVQIISASLDTVVMGVPKQNMIFSSQNMGVITYQDALHGSCIKQAYEDIALFILNGKPENNINKCYEWEYYPGKSITDEDLYFYNFIK